MASLIKVRLARSPGKCIARQRGTLVGLGLKRRGDVKILKDSAPVRGMILKMQHMLEVERFDGDEGLLDSARIRAARSGS